MPMDKAQAYKMQYDLYKMLFRAFCNLCDEEIDNLQEACFKKATTQLRPNNEVTLELIKEAYINLNNKAMDYTKVMESLKV